MASNLSEFCTFSNDEGDDDDDGGEEEDGSSEEDSSGSSGEEESGDEDEDEEEESEDEVVGVENVANAERITHSSEDDTEKECCPVCLNKFIGQELGTPENCEHTFCFDCIKEWSKNINTCPIDRTEFNFIHLRAVPGGSTLKKVKVKVQPKEPEDAVQESVTLCEICRSGDREDRLLLCDGCDLAYHCECLDPPLFYIPIEEWFCPPCSGVLQNRAVAGPSSSRRRVIPRTRASETVRSRVQNLRTGHSSTPRSTSESRKSNATKTTRRRKRRTYRRTYKKVVQLARTKKDMNNALKNKVGVRGSTVIVTYKRRRRRRRRTTKRRFSRKSVASTRALPIPSTKQRIAKHLGISKAQGSSAPQVKQPSGSRSGSRVSRLPTHSIFGNHNQLMDFDENFNEDVSNMPSTSSSTSQRGSNYSSSPSTSGLNILDSIMAGQKLLHSKSDAITIKTDGTLILKDSSSSSKTVSSMKKNEPVQPTRTPMSVALVKTGVKSVTSSTNKKSASVSAGSSKPKDVTRSKASKPTKEKIASGTNSSSSQWTSKNNCSNSKSYSDLMNNVRMSKAKECYKKSSASLINMHSRKQKTTSTNKPAHDENKTVDTLIDEFQRDTPSDWETELSNKIETIGSNKKKRVNSSLELENNSSNSTFSGFQSDKSVPLSSFSDDATNISVETSKICIKKEVLSDEETNSGAICDSESVNNLYRKYSSEETKNDNSVESRNIRQQGVDMNEICPRIKIESVSSDSEFDVKNDSLNIPKSVHDQSSKYICKTEDSSDCEASQSIIDTTPMLSSSSRIDLNTGIALQRKIKEEVSSDSEDLSQSLVSTADPNFVSQSISIYSSKHKEENFSNEKSKEFFDSSTRDNLQKKVFRKNTVTSGPPELSNFSVSVLPTTINCFDNEDLPCTQVHDSEAMNNSSDDDDEEEDIPCTQAISSPAVMEDTSDDDLPCTQGLFLSNGKNNLSDNCVLPCTQAVSVSENSIHKDIDLPCTQVVTPSFGRGNLIDEEKLPVTQIALSRTARVDLIDDEELPCTQVAPLSKARKDLIGDDELPCTQFVIPRVSRKNLICDDDLPCTQAVSVSVLDNNSSDDEEEDNLPCTQAVPVSVLDDNSSDDEEEDNLPCTQAVSVSALNNNSSDDDDGGDDENDLPCTQAMSLSFAKPDVLEDDSLLSTQVVSFANSKPTSNIVSAPQNSLIGLSNKNKNSIDFDSKGVKDVIMCDKVQETQVNLLQRTKSTNLHNSCDDECSDDVIPPTQINFEFIKPAAVPNKPFISRTSSRDSKLLPTTYLGSSKLSNKKTFSNDKTNFQDSLPPTQVFRGNPETLDLPETQSNTMVNDESFDLPATQISDASSKIIDVKGTNLSHPQLMKNYSSDLPVSQVSCHLLKEKNMPKSLDKNINVECNSLPATQVFSSTLKQTHLHSNTIDVEDSESVDLPPTQVNVSISEAVKCHDSTVIGNSKSVPADQSLKVSNVSFKEVSSMHSEITKASSDKSMLSENISPDSECEKTKNSNINNILSNIKHLVQSLSVKAPADSSCQVTDNRENSLDKNEENALDDVNSINVDSELSEKSITNEDTLEEINNCKNLENKDLDIDENLPHEKLMEIANKSSRVVPNKNVGIHKHLPQVIAKLPVKDHVKLKPSNRRTFSFEEVAKLEEPKKVHRNSSTDLIQNSNFNTFENNASDDDDFPPTQKVDFGSIMNRQTGNKNINSKSHSNTSEITSHPILQPELNSLKATKTFQNSPCSNGEGTDDFPNTQLNACQNKDINSPITPLLVGSSKSKTISKAQACTDSENKSTEFSLQHINKVSRLSSCTDEVILPSTETFIRSENILNSQINPNELLSVSDESNMSKNKQKTLKNKSSAHIISVRNRVPSKQSKDKKSSTYVDADDLHSTEVSNNIPQKKLSNKSIDKTKNSKFHQNNSSEFSSDNTCRKKSKTSEEKNIRDSIQSKTRELSSEYELDDLPATQVSENTRRAMKNLSCYDDIGKNNLNDTFNQNKLGENVSSGNNKSSNLKELSEATDISNRTVQKQNNSTIDGMWKVKESNQRNTLQNSLSNLEDTESYNQKKLKRRCESEKNVVDGMHKSDHNLSSNKLKVAIANRKTAQNSAVYKSVSDTTDKQFDSSFNNNCTVIVKQEKLDHDFEVPLIETQKANLLDSSYASHDIGRIRIKTENPSDSLPSVQVPTFNQANNSVDGSVINNVLLLPTSIKREKNSDDEDEITIIDVVKDTNSKVQEEIIIDDEDNELIIPPAIEKSQPACLIKCEKEVSAPIEVDITSVKIEKISNCSEKVMPKVGSDYTCSKKKALEKQKIRESVQSKTRELSSDYELEDLPATQVSEHTRKAMRNLSHDKIGKNNDAFDPKKRVENVSSHKNNSSSLRSKIEKISDKDVPKTKHQSIKLSKHNEKKDSKAVSTTKEKEQMSDKDANSNLNKSHKPGDKRKISKDGSLSKEDKKKAKKDNLQSKPETISHKHETNLKRSKCGADAVREKRVDCDSKKPKSSSSKNNPELSSVQNVQNQEKLKTSDKQRINTVEKENNASPNNDMKNIIITLKPSKKRPHESSETKSDQKRGKYNYLDSESCSSENSCNKNSLGINTDSNIKSKKNSDIMDDRVSSSTPNSDLSMGSVNLHYTNNLSKPLQTKDVKKILNKQDLKEEIANEVKLVLKPFFVSGLISKEDYKDIMRRAVPKIFTNCHNAIHQEKIRKLVLSYVAMLSKS